MFTTYVTSSQTSFSLSPRQHSAISRMRTAHDRRCCMNTDRGQTDRQTDVFRLQTSSSSSVAESLPRGCACIHGRQTVLPRSSGDGGQGGRGVKGEWSMS